MASEGPSATVFGAWGRTIAASILLLPAGLVDRDVSPLRAKFDPTLPRTDPAPGAQLRARAAHNACAGLRLLKAVARAHIG